jgi:integrase
MLKAKIEYYVVLADRYLGVDLLASVSGKGEALRKAAETGAIGGSPATESTNSVPSSVQVTMADLIDSHWAERIVTIKPRSQGKYRTIKERILEHFGSDCDVSQLDYYKCKEFRDWLHKYREPPLAPKTVNDYLDYFRSVLNFEMKTTGTLRVNPAEGVRMAETVSDKDKKPKFDLADLELILCKSREYSDDRFRKAHQFWLPLLAIYTGARMEELCQLLSSDIKIDSDSDLCVIDINEWDEEKSVKTGERRLVPIHPFLIELGIHRYAASRPKNSQLWPNLKYQQNRWSHAYVRQFKTFKDKAGIDPTPRFKTFHSFRHTVVSHLKDQDVQETVTAELVGHKVKGITYGLYGKQYQPEKILADAVMKLDWHEKLDLNHLVNSKWARPS